MTTYRTFRNNDPPRILQLFNLQARQSRGFGYLTGCDVLEQLVFSKPYFDRAGLMLAFDGDRLVGLCHAGFGCDETNSRLDASIGTICMLLVHPEYRRQGIGSALLEQGQAYLRARGASVQYAGALYPLNPFYLGLYGGSELPGVLESDTDAGPFFQHHGYQPADTCLVFQSRFETPVPGDDSRLPLLRRQVDLVVEPWPTTRTWWQTCVLGSMAALRYEMVHKEQQEPIGHAWVWVMETHSHAWGCTAVGIADFAITESMRGQGYGKVLLGSILKHLQEQQIGLVEVQTMERNVAACKLYESLGFQRIDTGWIYRLCE